MHFTRRLLVQHQAQVVVHQGADSKDSSRIHARAHDFQPNLVLGGDHDVLILGLVAGGLAVGTELHVGRDRVVRDEAGKRADLGEHSDLVDLFDDGVEDLALEGPEHDGLVLDRVHHETLAGLNHARADVIDGRDSNDEAVLARARAFDLCVELLADGIEKLRTKVARMKEDLVLEGDLKEEMKKN